MNNVYIIAEAGVNHNGSFEIARQLCQKAKECGANAVKFQTFKTEKIITMNAELADYQKENIGENKSQFQMLKELELSYSDFKDLKNYCDEIKIDFLSTPDEEDSLNFLISLGIDTIKIGSGEITNLYFLEQIGKTAKKVILSTGMATLSEIDTALNTLIEAGIERNNICLLHCTTEYPAPYEEVNLNAMLTLKNAFKIDVGYSDHTDGIEIPIAAAALGAKIIEKHFTLDKNMIGPDHKASLNPNEFSLMVKSIRNIEKSMGNGIKLPSKSELKNIPIVRKSIVAAENIKKGEIFTEKNITFKRPGTGISAANYKLILGTKAKRDFMKDEMIEL